MLRGLVPVSFRRYSDPFQSPRSLIVGPVSSAPIPLHPAPYRIILPDQIICRVPIGNSNSIVANRASFAEHQSVGRGRIRPKPLSVRWDN